MTNEGWAQLTTVGAPGYHPFGDALFIIDLLGRVGLLLGSLVVLLLFVLRRRGFPGAYTALAILAAGVFFVVEILSRLSRGHPSAMDAVLDASLFLVPACAWIAYLRLSDRAQSTFVR